MNRPLESGTVPEEGAIAEEKGEAVPSNSIIFARSETTHMPIELVHRTLTRTLSNPIYSTDSSGMLKDTLLETIEEDEDEGDYKQPANEPQTRLTIWDRIMCLFCCFCEEIAIASGHDMTTPVIAATSSTAAEQEGEGGAGVVFDYVENLPPAPFLDDQLPQHKGKKTLVLDLDETLVHSTFEKVEDCHYVIPVEIEGDLYDVYVYVRPGAVEFIERMSKLYEVVAYTASMDIYANPVLDLIDPDGLLTARLFRNHCRVGDCVFVKDLGLLGRDMSSVIMVDNAAQSFMFQPMNGIECTAFIDDMEDRELDEIAEFLEAIALKEDVRPFTKMWKESREVKVCGE